MSSPQVSVIVPAYNHGPFIDEAVESVLGGTECDFELIAIDDGSTDDTFSRLQRFAVDPRVTVLRQPNRGAHEALNRGLLACRGELVFVLNSDDAYHPERIDRLAAVLDDQPTVMVATTWIDVVNARGQRIGIKRAWHDLPPWPSRPGRRLSALGDPVLALLESNWVATSSNVAFRRHLVEAGIRFRPLRYTHDWDFLLTASAFGPVTIVEAPLVRYRVHGRNTIQEQGSGSAAGLGAMRFEILWTLARYCRDVLGRHASGHPLGDLEKRQMVSLPPFLTVERFRQMVSLRETEPAIFEALLAPEHPFRRHVTDELASYRS